MPLEVEVTCLNCHLPMTASYSLWHCDRCNANVNVQVQTKL